MSTHKIEIAPASTWIGRSAQLERGPLSVSANRRFLQHADGSPFFWLGDTAWELFHRLTREEAEDFLEIRRRQGFTVIQAVALAEFAGLTAPNAYGHLPLQDLDPRTPNDDYFAHVDWVIDCAASKGLYIGFLPTWGDKVVRDAWGDGPIVFDADNAHAYGQWLGARYKDRGNLIWILGGDRPAVWKEKDDHRAVWNAMAAGLDAGAGKHLLTTYHPAGGSEQRTSVHLHSAPWLDLNMMQSGHGGGHDVPVWAAIASDYALTPVKPTLDGEPNYEDHPVNPWPSWDPAFGYYRDHDVRKQVYRSVFAGGCGVTYGHHAVWQFFEPVRREPVNYPDRSWREAAVRPGAEQMVHLRRLIESRPFLSRVPDQAVIAGEAGQGASHMRATRDAGGAYALVYVPNTQTVHVRMDCIQGARARLAWYDPRTGGEIALGVFPASGVRFFTTPDYGPDWVLTLDRVE